MAFKKLPFDRLWQGQKRTTARGFVNFGAYVSRARILYQGVKITSTCVANFVESAMFHCHSLWLFTSSDLKTIVGPSFVFGTANAFAFMSHGLPSSGINPSGLIIRRFPLVLVWIWMNLLPFTINNQKGPEAIEEDRANKPWRTLPSGRMTSQQARKLMLALYPVAVALSTLTGGIRQSISLVILGIWYNNFAGGDKSCVVRNAINAYGYVCFTSGAMEVALGVPLPLDTKLVRWFAVLAAIIFTTVHLQDMYDQTGDKIRGRKTVPIVVGDGPARWSIAMPMVFWGLVCPCLWGGGNLIVLLSTVLAGIVAARSLSLRTVESDRLTFKFWNVWMAFVFALPLISHG